MIIDELKTLLREGINNQPNCKFLDEVILYYILGQKFRYKNFKYGNTPKDPRIHLMLRIQDNEMRIATQINILKIAKKLDWSADKINQISSGAMTGHVTFRQKELSLENFDKPEEEAENGKIFKGVFESNRFLLLPPLRKLFGFVTGSYHINKQEVFDVLLSGYKSDANKIIKQVGTARVEGYLGASLVITAGIHSLPEEFTSWNFQFISKEILTNPLKPQLANDEKLKEFANKVNNLPEIKEKLVVRDTIYSKLEELKKEYMQLRTGIRSERVSYNYCLQTFKIASIHCLSEGRNEIISTDLEQAHKVSIKSLELMNLMGKKQ